MVTVTGHKNDNIIRENENQTTLVEILKDIIIEITDRAYELESVKNSENQRFLFKRIYTNILSDYKKEWFMEKYTFDKYADDLPFYFNDLEKKCVPAEYLIAFYGDKLGKDGVEFSRQSSIEDVEECLSNWSLFKGKQITNEDKFGIIVLRNGKVVDFEINSEKKYDDKLKADYYEYTIANITDKEDNQILNDYFEEFYILYEQPKMKQL